MIDANALGVPGYEDAVLIGEGGFASVYRARQPAFNRLVAVKVLSKVRLDERTRRRFERERAAIGSLSGHPNIVTVYESGLTSHGVPYLAMEYLPNGTLADLVAREGTLPWEQVVHIGVRLAGAMESAHRDGILHRDLKPENVLLSGFGEPQLSDFGIARVLASPETRTGEQLFSVAHTAPEVINGEQFSAQADVYALGSTLFTLLRGRPPFHRDGEELLLPLFARIAGHPPPDLRPTGVPEEVCRILERALAKRPADRHTSALELAEDLRRAQTASGLTATVPLVTGRADGVTWAHSGPPAQRRRRALLLGVPAVSAVAAVAVAVVALGGRSERPPLSGTRTETTVAATAASTTVPTTTSTITAPVPFPSGTQPLPAGRYVAPRFRAPFTFSLPEGWRSLGTAGPDYLDLVRTDGDATSILTLMRVTQVFDRQRAPASAAQARDALVATPDDLPGWIRGHPRLTAGPLTPVTKGAFSGTAVEARPVTPYVYPDCHGDQPVRPCVLLFLAADGLPVFISEGFVARFHFLRVGAETLVAIVEATPGEFAGFATEADRVLSSLAS